MQKNILKKEVNSMDCTIPVLAWTFGDTLSVNATAIANAVAKVAAPAFGK